MIWKPNTNYYIELSKDRLKEVIDTMLVKIMGYDAEQEWKLEDVCHNLKYLANGNIACNIQLRNSNYMKSNNVLDYIDSEYFDLAKYYYQTDTFLTEKEYRDLKPLETLIINN